MKSTRPNGHNHQASEGNLSPHRRNFCPQSTGIAEPVQQGLQPGTRASGHNLLKTGIARARRNPAARRGTNGLLGTYQPTSKPKARHVRAVFLFEPFFRSPDIFALGI
jgi:hypothetical protein